MMNDKLIPVLLGADLNCYNVARAFHEAYGAVSYAFGKYPLGATAHSRIVRFTAVPDLANPDVLMRVLEDFARTHEGTRVLLGCTDEYAAMITAHRHSLSEWYVVACPEADLVEKITQKDRFYEYCDRFGIPHPKTVVLTQSARALPDKLPFDYPIIVKPASSALYWLHPFEGMKKVYTAADPAEAERIISAIYASGYPGKLILQEMIPGDDSHMYVLTAYSDAAGKVRMMCLGHVLLEEHTPKGLGNHAAIITEKNRPLMERYKDFLEAIGYVGFSNFDIKYDARTDTYCAFEINTRQGRSNYYVTASGNNIAKLIVRDRITRDLPEGCVYNENRVYWRYIPDRIVDTYVPEQFAKQARALKKQGKAASSLRYAYDLRCNPKRRCFVSVHEWHHHKKFKTYYKVETQ